MPNDSLTLALDGDVTLRDFSIAMGSLNDLLAALSAHVSPEANISWMIEMLDRSSAITTLRGQDGAGDTLVVERVVRAYGLVGTSLERKEVIPYAEAVRAPANKLTSLISSRIPAIRFETDESSAYVAEVAQGEAAPLLPSWTYGSIQGRIQTLTNRGSLHFTLYDTQWDRAVQCYLKEHDEARMMNAWGHMAFVEGRIKRDPRTGRPLTIRQIDSVVLLPDYGPDAWTKLQGSVPSDGEASESFVRRLRDREE